MTISPCSLLNVSCKDNTDCCDKAWTAFFKNIDNVPEEKAEKIIAAIVKKVKSQKSAKDATLLGQIAWFKFKLVKDYKHVLIKASQSDFAHLRRAAMGAMKMFEIAEAVYYQSHPEEKPEEVEPERPKHPEYCIIRPNLPANFTQTTVQEVNRSVDGDTYIIDADFDGDGKNDSVRVDGINTPEFGKGPTLKSRLRGAESGAIPAWKELKSLFEAANNQAYISTNLRDSYRRLITRTLLKVENGFLDISASLIRKGWGHAYFVDIKDEEQYACYIYLQAQAKQEKIGIWELSTFQRGAEFKSIHITSFHPNAKGAINPGTGKYEDEPLFNEYVRIVNTSNAPINMRDYRIYNKASGKKVDLPYFILPPGRTLKIATGDIKTNSDPKKELVLSLAMDKPFWENKDEGGACLIIEDLDGNTVDSAARYGYQGCE